MPEADFRLPLRDANNNPYSSMAGDPPLRVKLRAQGFGPSGRPPVRRAGQRLQGMPLGSGQWLGNWHGRS